VHTFAEKQGQIQGSNSTRSFKPVPGRRAEPRLLPGNAGAATHFAHNFSRVPAFSIEPQIQRACACGGECPKCREKHGDDEPLQAKHEGAGNASEAVISPGVHEVLRSSGQPLAPDVRSFMETRFGHDFSRVRIHTDSKAAETAHTMEARAYTLGRDIVFGAAQYAPRTTAGRQLLAHELAHTIQQRSSVALPMQAKLRLSRASDPAEAAADQAADAVMRGDQAPALDRVPGSIVHRQQQRTCSRGAESGDRTTVTCSDGAEYEVRTVILSGLVPNTEVSATGGLDRSTIYFQLRICRGRNEVQIRTGIDVAQPVQRLVENILRGGGVEGVRLEPEVRITWARSRDFEIQAYGGPTVVGGAPRVGGRGGLRGRIGPLTGQLEVGSDPTLTGPGGRPEIHGTGSLETSLGRVREVDCRTEQKTVSYECTSIRHTDPVAPIPADDVQAYVFFDYATDRVIAPTPLLQRGSQVLTETLAALATQGYRAQSIDAHTSPEGPRGPSRRPGGFVGNDTLSVQRRDAALTWLRTNCADCIGTEPSTTAESELYSGVTRSGRELEGDPLTRRAREGFLGHNVEPADPLRRPDHDRLATLPLAQQRAELYPLLRRAVIHLHREGTPGEASRRVPGQTGSCPADVRAAMQRR
jgi:Domain of unknown function (DUF4157)